MKVCQKLYFFGLFRFKFSDFGVKILTLKLQDNNFVLENNFTNSKTNQNFCMSFISFLCLSCLAAFNLLLAQKINLFWNFWFIKIFLQLLGLINFADEVFFKSFYLKNRRKAVLEDIHNHSHKNFPSVNIRVNIRVSLSLVWIRNLENNFYSSVNVIWETNRMVQKYKFSNQQGKLWWLFFVFCFKFYFLFEIYYFIGYALENWYYRILWYFKKYVLVPQNGKQQFFGVWKDV